VPHANDELFSARNSLRDYLQSRREQALAEIERYDANRFLNSNPEDLSSYFVQKYEVAVPVILDDGITADQRETKIDVSGRFEYGAWPGERVVVPGTELTLHVPFDGDVDLIRYRASTFSTSPPRGRVAGQEVVLTYTAPHVDAGTARSYFEEQLGELRRYLAWTAAELQQFNMSLAVTLRQAIDARRNRLLANQNAVASLGFPLKTRPDAPKTHAVPTVRRKVIPAPPPASTTPYVPEPELSNDVYDQILGVLANMVRVMEQSPEAFSTLGEQDLRTHFLVQLNGQFEGRATGETFRGSGRTDILLTENDRSVFIAECKFWDGPSSLTAAMDQILDYATWRDAKSALLLFSRNADFSSVVAQVPGVIETHPQTKGAVQTIAETVFRSRLLQRNDSAREIILTTLVYNVPTVRVTSDRLRPRKGRSST